MHEVERSKSSLAPKDKLQGGQLTPGAHFAHPFRIIYIHTRCPHFPIPHFRLSLIPIIGMDKHQEYERVFNHFDENKDGKISPAELQQCVKAIGGELSREEAEVAVEVLDTDGDGLLGLEDFIRLVEEAGEEEKVNDLKEAFKMYEMEGCGCITPKSLKRMLSRLGESRTLEECKSMIAQFDLNGDGVLNFDEFRVMML
ncbi:hypothetical protein Godav_002611 [Gossypium davidsonii]|uniref:EF-hand domain-containing protein n=1 Tax=Gossypium davidsonii TaxID=34287 RepID=A0A7J8SXK9_GOSDV|nr:hypothetical protein [Gossypium davidsonii]